MQVAKKRKAQRSQSHQRGSHPYRSPKFENDGNGRNIKNFGAQTTSSNGLNQIPVKPILKNGSNYYLE